MVGPEESSESLAYMMVVLIVAFYVVFLISANEYNLFVYIMLFLGALFLGFKTEMLGFSAPGSFFVGLMFGLMCNIYTALFALGKFGVEAVSSLLILAYMALLLGFVSLFFAGVAFIVKKMSYH